MARLPEINRGSFTYAFSGKQNQVKLTAKEGVLLFEIDDCGHMKYASFPIGRSSIISATRYRPGHANQKREISASQTGEL